MKYYCLLNGHVYGKGDLEFMGELFTDYVVNMKMYDRNEVEFKIVKDDERLDVVEMRMRLI